MELLIRAQSFNATLLIGNELLSLNTKGINDTLHGKRQYRVVNIVSFYKICSYTLYCEISEAGWGEWVITASVHPLYLYRTSHQTQLDSCRWHLFWRVWRLIEDVFDAWGIKSNTLDFPNLGAAVWSCSAAMACVPPHQSCSQAEKCELKTCWFQNWFWNLMVNSGIILICLMTIRAVPMSSRSFIIKMDKVSPPSPLLSIEANIFVCQVLHVEFLDPEFEICSRALKMFPHYRSPTMSQQDFKLVFWTLPSGYPFSVIMIMFFLTNFLLHLDLSFTCRYSFYFAKIKTKTCLKAHQINLRIKYVYISVDFCINFVF